MLDVQDLQSQLEWVVLLTNLMLHFRPTQHNKVSSFTHLKGVLSSLG